MQELLGTTLPVFIGLTLILIGFAAFMTGQALAATWRPFWQMLPYAALLAGADRFLSFALFEGELLSPGGYLVDFAVLFGIGAGAFRMTRAYRMVTQYPWLYERAGLFGWRARSTG